MAFKILSLDGGGTWALLQAMALDDMYPGLTGHEILAKFDLAVANSGGSIVLAGLALDMPISQIAQFFQNQDMRRAIFFKRSLIQTLLSRLPIFPKYIAAEKKIGLREVMGAKSATPLAELATQMPIWPRGPLGEPVRILITAFDYDRQREALLRSYDIPASGAQADPTALSDAVHASSNAPVMYFDAPALVDQKRYWDGAMGGYNNPIMAAIVDAMCLGHRPENMRALSIGTGMVRLVPPDLDIPPGSISPDLGAPYAKSTILNNVKLAAGCITDDPPDAASYTAHIVLGGHPKECHNFVRLNPLAQPVKDLKGVWRSPSQLTDAQFSALKNLGMDAVETADVAEIKNLGTAWIMHGLQNQPIRMQDDLSPAVGDATYAIAKARWDKLATASQQSCHTS